MKPSLSRLGSPETTVKFPDEKEIHKYMNRHPTSTPTIEGDLNTSIRVNLYVPNVFAAIAKRFANKEMSRSQIIDHVRAAVDNAILKDGTRHQIGLLNERVSLEKLIDQWEREDVKDYQIPNRFLNMMQFKREILPSTTPSLLSKTIEVCTSVMNDLLDDAEYNNSRGKSVHSRRE